MLLVVSVVKNTSLILDLSPNYFYLQTHPHRGCIHGFTAFRLFVWRNWQQLVSLANYSSVSIFLGFLYWQVLLMRSVLYCLIACHWQVWAVIWSVYRDVSIPSDVHLSVTSFPRPNLSLTIGFLSLIFCIMHAFSNEAWVSKKNLAQVWPN